MTATSASATLSVRVDLHDGARCDVVSGPLTTTTLALHDADGDDATVSFDRAKARQLIDAITLVAGLAPTGARIDLATALAGSARVLFQRLDDELEKADPAAADRIRVAMIAHLRSKVPALLGGAL